MPLSGLQALVVESSIPDFLCLVPRYQSTHMSKCHLVPTTESQRGCEKGSFWRHAGPSDHCFLASSQGWDLDDPVVPSAASGQGGSPGTETS